MTEQPEATDLLVRDPAPTSASPPPPDVAAHPRSPRRRFDNLQAWTTTIVAVAALLLSVLGLVQTNTAPEVSVLLPNQIRIVQGGSPSLQLYLQPSLVVGRKSDRTAVVRTFHLELHRADGAVPDPYVYWDEIGQFAWSGASGGLDYQYVGDPSPVVVTQDKPQSPMLTLAANGYVLTAGRWLGTFSALPR